MIIKKLTLCNEITLSDHDFKMLNQVITSINSEWRGAEIHLEEDEIDFIRRLFLKLPASE